MKRERHYTEAESARLEILRKQKAEIQAEINQISRAETMREARRKAAEKAEKVKKTGKIHGKRYRELTAEERRAYWRETQRKSRERRADT